MTGEIQEQVDQFWRSDRPAEVMWNSWEDPHRTQILTALSCIPPFKSVYEMGCGAGPNLRLIKHHRPTVKVGGSEPNVGLRMWAQKHLDTELSFAEFPNFPSREWDVALSCYAMAYVPVATVKDTLDNVGSPFLILVEPHAYVEPYGPPGWYSHTAMPHHAHDYWSLLQDTGWRILWRWPLYPHKHGLNVVTVAEKH